MKVEEAMQMTKNIQRNEVKASQVSRTIRVQRFANLEPSGTYENSQPHYSRLSYCLKIASTVSSPLCHLVTSSVEKRGKSMCLASSMPDGGSV
jgi:hypothetical protein